MRNALNIMTLSMIAILLVVALGVHADSDLSDTPEARKTLSDAP